MTTLRRSLLSFLGAAAVAACGGGGAGPGPTNSLIKGPGAGQSDTVLATLTIQLSVSVRDQSNAAVQGVGVSWTAPAGGKVNGSPTATTTTDASGAATVTVTFGPAAGSQTVSAASTGLSGSPVTFSETATPGNAFAIALSAQSATSGTANAALTYTVKARDKYGNGRPGVTILWAAIAGGGPVAPDSNATDATGAASTVHHLGASLGFDTVTATSKIPLQGSPVTFAATIVQAPATADVTVGPGVVFSPDSVTVRVGGTVTFTWAAGSSLHGVNWTSSPTTLPANSANLISGTYPVTLNAAGTYTYNCTVHGASMSGTIEVQ
jgi:plastocyanin